jgi:uncharacterized protein YbjT (DUF2867 family)
VIRHLSESSTKPYRIRAITRDDQSERAKAYSSKGIQVVKADMEKEEDHQRIFEDADYAMVRFLSLTWNSKKRIFTHFWLKSDHHPFDSEG